MLTIRLRRAGKRHQPAYRVVITEHTAPIQGKFLEVVGTYNPRARHFAVKEDRILHWLEHGAQPSERMAKLLVSSGIKHRLLALPDYDRKPKRSPKKSGASTEPVAAAEKEQTNEAATEMSEPATEAATELVKEASEPVSDEAGAEGSNPEPVSEEQPKEE